MTTGIDIVRVKWGYENSKEIGVFSNRLVLKDEVKDLINELVRIHILQEDKKGNYDMNIMFTKGFFLRVDTVEPDYIDNEKRVSKI